MVVALSLTIKKITGIFLSFLSALHLFQIRSNQLKSNDLFLQCSVMVAERSQRDKIILSQEILERRKNENILTDKT
jgi:hypothetical protein